MSRAFSFEHSLKFRNPWPLHRLVSDRVKGIPKKTGEWLQLSCGVEDAFPVKMGELVISLLPMPSLVSSI
jgi:hypothetical protein